MKYGYTSNMKQCTALLLRVLVITLLLTQAWILRADSDYDEARRLQQSGDILSLEVILEKLRPEYSGKVLEVDLETKSGQFVYELEILGDDGIVRELIVDAKTGVLLHSERDD